MNCKNKEASRLLASFSFPEKEKSYFSEETALKIENGCAIIPVILQITYV